MIIIRHLGEPTLLVEYHAAAAVVDGVGKSQTLQNLAGLW